VNDQVNEPAKVGVVAPEVLLSYDGLSFLKALIAGELPVPPIAETLGFRLAEAEPGRAVFTGTPAYKHYNPIGTVHAGFAATLLDSCVACSVHTTLAKGETYTTLELKINLVRALTDKVGPVFAEGRVVHRGRQIATAEGTLKDGAGKLYAHATTTCIIFPAKG
jgi:uncharacterized protein (TIGR00369 family)